jgi:hypothetical protein
MSLSIEPKSGEYGAVPHLDEDEDQLTEKEMLFEKYKLALIMCIVIILGPLNFVLYKVMFEAYGSDGSFFVSNAVNIVYVLVGGVVLAYADARGEISSDAKTTSHGKFIVMAACDGLAGFFAAMGAVYTSGAVRIPFMLFLLFLFIMVSLSLLSFYCSLLAFSDTT